MHSTCRIVGEKEENTNVTVDHLRVSYHGKRDTMLYLKALLRYPTPACNRGGFTHGTFEQPGRDRPAAVALSQICAKSSTTEGQQDVRLSTGARASLTVSRRKIAQKTKRRKKTTPDAGEIVVTTHRGYILRQIGKTNIVPLFLTGERNAKNQRMQYTLAEEFHNNYKT